jgi:DNA-binding NarL/FixJ family response regulator
MDIRMPGRDGVSATAAITADPALTGTRVIVLTTFDLDEYVHAALRAGASGFLLKDAQPADLLAAVHQVAQGESVLAPSLVRRLIAAFVKTPASEAKPAWDGLADGTGDRGLGGGRARFDQRRDRRRAAHVRGDREDPRRPPPHQVECP